MIGHNLWSRTLSKARSAVVSKGPALSDAKQVHSIIHSSDGCNGIKFPIIALGQMSKVVTFCVMLAMWVSVITKASMAQLHFRARNGHRFVVRGRQLQIVD